MECKRSGIGYCTDFKYCSLKCKVKWLWHNIYNIKTVLSVKCSVHCSSWGEGLWMEMVGGKEDYCIMCLCVGRWGGDMEATTLRKKLFLSLLVCVLTVLYLFLMDEQSVG